MSKRKRDSNDSISVKGFFRVALDEQGKIIGDSGWCKNTVPNDGFGDYLVKLIANQAGSKQIAFVALGTGTAPATNGTSLSGEIADSAAAATRKAITYSNSGSRTVRFTATFYSSNSHISAAQVLQNIGLFHTSSAGTIFAGNTYTTSSVNTNQNVNITYDIQFS
jgi:hypothetical protein